MFARTPTAHRSPVLTLALLLVLLLTQQFGLQHGVLHLRAGPVVGWFTGAPGAGPVETRQRVAGQLVPGQTVGGLVLGGTVAAAAPVAVDGAADSSTDPLCPVCLVLAAIGCAALLGLLRWLVALQADAAPAAPARRTPARPARRQHRARAPPRVLALS